MKKKSGKNVYEKKITLGRDRDGTPVRKSITGRTIAELNQKIEEAKQNWMLMHDIDDSILFSTYAQRWLVNTKGILSLNTKRMYKETLDRHIIPEIGDLYFSEITLQDLQKIISDRADKYETCNKIKLTLRQIFEAAMEDDLVKKINTKKLVLPPKPQKEKRPLTKAETEAVFKADLPDAQNIFLKLLYYTGIRREEALALEASDFDFDESSLRINKVIVFDENTPVLKPQAKTSAGNRKIPIPEVFKPDLKKYIDSHAKILFDQARNPGQYMSKSSYNKFWKSITAALGVVTPSAESLTAHMFRHNYATLLYYSDVSPKMAAKLLGHEGTQMIMEIYAHLDESRENTSEKLNTMFEKETPQP